MAICNNMRIFIYVCVIVHIYIIIIIIVDNIIIISLIIIIIICHNISSQYIHTYYIMLHVYFALCTLMQCTIRPSHAKPLTAKKT